MIQAESPESPAGTCVECGSDHVVKNVCRECGVVQPDPLWGEEVLVMASGQMARAGQEQVWRQPHYVAPFCGYSTQPMRMRGGKPVPTRQETNHPANRANYERVRTDIWHVLELVGPGMEHARRCRIQATAVGLFRKCCQHHAPRNYVALGMTCLHVAMRQNNLSIPLRKLFDTIAARAHHYSFSVFYQNMAEYNAVLRGVPQTTFASYLGGFLENTIHHVQETRALNGQARSFALTMRACTRWIAGKVQRKVRGQNPVAVAAAVVYVAGWHATRPHAVTQAQVAGVAQIPEYGIRDQVEWIKAVLCGQASPVPPVTLKSQPTPAKQVPRLPAGTVETLKVYHMNPEHAKQIVSLLNKGDPLDRNAMVPLLNLPRTTIFDTLTVLVQDHVVATTKAFNGRRGRPRVLYTLRGD